MPDWLAATCSTNSLSTPIIIAALIAYGLNLYFNSNSKFSRNPAKPPETETGPNNSRKTEYTNAGGVINGAISLISLVGIFLAFNNC